MRPSRSRCRGHLPRRRFHWLAAHEPARVLRSALAAAAAAEAVSAAEVTLEHLDLALEVLPATGVATTDLWATMLRELELRSAEAAHRAGMPSRAVDYASAVLGRVDPAATRSPPAGSTSGWASTGGPPASSTRPWTNSVEPST